MGIGREPGPAPHVHYLQSIRGGPEDQLKGHHPPGIIHEYGYVSSVSGLRGSARSNPQPGKLDIDIDRSTGHAHLVCAAVGIRDYNSAGLELDRCGGIGIGVHYQQQDFPLSGWNGGKLW